MVVKGSCILWTGVISLATLIMLMYMRMIKSSAESGYFPEWHHQRFYNLQQIRPGQLDRQVSHPVTSPSKKKKKKLVSLSRLFHYPCPPNIFGSVSILHVWICSGVLRIILSAWVWLCSASFRSSSAHA
jgi:hypothetical protein